LTEKKDTRKQNALPHAAKKKTEEKVPKISLLRGHLRTQYVKCGRSNCRCRNNNGHGPYYYRVITINGQKRKKYVKKGDLSAVRAGINEHRRQKAEIKQFNQEAVESWRTLKSQFRQLDQLINALGYNI
jgi:hypothetical protein